MNTERKNDENMCQYESVEDIKANLRSTKPENWNTIELFQWIVFFFLPDNYIDDTNFTFERYQYLNGQILTKLKVDHMQSVDPDYGIMLYTQFMQFNTSSELKNNNPLFKRSSSAIRNLTNQRFIIWLVKSFIPENSIPFSDFNFKEFSRYDGETLIRKSCDEMQNIDQKYGKLLYERLNDLNSLCENYQQTKKRALINSEEVLAKIVRKENKPVVTITEQVYPELVLSMFSPTQIGLEEKQQSFNIPPFNVLPLSPAPSEDLYMYEKSSDNNSVESYKSEEPNELKRQTRNQVNTSRLQRALQSVDDDSDSEEMNINMNKNNSFNLKKMKNCIHLWQFLRDLLQDKNYNPSVIAWIDPRKGVFKVVEPNTVSQMWAYKKGRKSMTYENLSRGLRHSRKNGYFRQVAPMSSYGKKLVYQFGPKSIQHCKWLQEIVETK